MYCSKEGVLDVYVEEIYKMDPHPLSILSFRRILFSHPYSFLISQYCKIKIGVAIIDNYYEET